MLRWGGAGGSARVRTFSIATRLEGRASAHAWCIFEERGVLKNQFVNLPTRKPWRLEPGEPGVAHSTGTGHDRSVLLSPVSRQDVPAVW